MRDALARLEGTSTSTPEPNAAQIAAAAKQNPEQQSAMIQGMVVRLAARLKEDGSNVEGWLRLVRSYKVLGEPDKARTAIADAQQALASDPSKLDTLNAALSSLETDQAHLAEMGTAQKPPQINEQMTRLPNVEPEHQATIQSMVERLAARLRQDGSDVEGWVRLVRSYKVLGESDKALAAGLEARQALATDPAKLQQFAQGTEDLDQTKAAPVVQSTPFGASAAAPEHGSATAQDMIERLASRLRADGSDPAGWVVLIRSYLTLNEKDKAIAAIGSARHALADDAKRLEQFNSALKKFNIFD